MNIDGHTEFEVYGIWPSEGGRGRDLEGGRDFGKDG